MLVEALLKGRQSTAIIAQLQGYRCLFLSRVAPLRYNLRLSCCSSFIVASSRVHDSSERATQCGRNGGATISGVAKGGLRGAGPPPPPPLTFLPPCLTSAPPA